ncbi:putative NTPase [Frog virus 3]
MDTSPYDFLKLYPWLSRGEADKGTLLDAFPGETFEQSLALDVAMRRAVQDDPAFGHQKLVETFLSEDTPYRELLLFHAPGTGKTCTVVSVAERAKEKGLTRGCIVLARGAALLRNFLHELVFNCGTGGRYIPEGYADMGDQERTRKIRKAVSSYYQFRTYETFAKSVATMSAEAIRARYDRFVIVMDEVHHLRSVQAEGVNTYSAISRFLRTVRGCVKMLLTGTPMTNEPGELADVLNLILPQDKTIRPEDGIFSNSGDLLKPDELAERVRGRVSYLKAARPDAGLTFAGEVLGGTGMTHLRLVRLEMSAFQSDAYASAWDQDAGDRNIFSNSRQCSLAVMPDRRWGSAAEARNPSQVRRMAGQNLAEYSVKYDYLVRVASSSPKTFAYCEYVNGSGLSLLSDILLANGWRRATGRETTPGKRFALLTASQKNIHKIVQRFNHEDNVDGAYISLLLGSRVVAEGLTFKEVRHTVILTPHWNYTETAQAIARSWRAGSHDRLKARGEAVAVTVHRLVAVPRGRDTPRSIDSDMYAVSEVKDKRIKAVERILMTSAADCSLLRSRNLYPSEFDGSRECEYGRCAYRCSNVSVEPGPLPALLGASAAEAVAQVRLDGGGDPAIMKVDMSTLWAEVAAGRRYVNRWGDGAVLRAEGGRLELSAPYGSSEEGRWGDFYKTRNLCYAKMDQDHLRADDLRDSLPQEVEELLTVSPVETIGETASAMPQEVATAILMACVQARADGKTLNAVRRDALLDFYKGFYAMGPSGWTVWLHARGVNAKVYDGRRWNPADKDTLEFLAARSAKFTDTRIGYYGLYNPNLKDFCIRDVTQGKRDKVDLRKLTVGRRCVDWDQRTLVHIVARLMKIDGRRDFMPHATLREMRELAEQDPLHEPSDLTSKEACRRFLFWTQKGDNKFRRQDICKAMEKWFIENDLMEDNFDCGHQHKRRGKFA